MSGRPDRDLQMWTSGPVAHLKLDKMHPHLWSGLRLKRHTMLGDSAKVAPTNFRRPVQTREAG